MNDVRLTACTNANGAQIWCSIGQPPNTNMGSANSDYPYTGSWNYDYYCQSAYITEQPAQSTYKNPS